MWIITHKSLSGLTIKTETQIYDGTTYHPVSWTQYTHDNRGRLTNVTNSNGTTEKYEYGCCGKIYERKADGTEYRYTYDILGRISTETKVGTTDQPDITTTYTYDNIGNILTQTVTAGDLSLTTTNTYDLGGHLIQTKSPSGLITQYDHDATAGTITTTYPGGATRTTKSHFDGTIQSITGTAAINQYKTHGLENGLEWTKTTQVAPDGPSWTKTYTDAQGRLVKTERPSPNGNIMVSENFYDTNGNLIRSTQPGQADTLYVYNELGEVTMSGLDVDGDGALTLASMDRMLS